MNEHIIPRGFIDLKDMKKSEIERVLYNLHAVGYQPLSNSLASYFSKFTKPNWIMINPYFNKCYILSGRWSVALSMDSDAPRPLFNDHFDIEKLRDFHFSINHGRIQDIYSENFPMKFSMDSFAIGCTWFSFDSFDTIRDAYEEQNEKYYDRRLSFRGALFGVSKKRKVLLYKLDIDGSLKFDKAILEINFESENLTFKRKARFDRGYIVSINKFQAIKERISIIREYNKYFKIDQ